MFHWVYCCQKALGRNRKVHVCESSWLVDELIRFLPPGEQTASMTLSKALGLYV